MLMHKATVCFAELVNVLYYVFKQGNQGAAFLWGELYVLFYLTGCAAYQSLPAANSEEGQIYLVTGSQGAGGPQRQPAARTQRHVLCLQSCSWGFQGRSQSHWSHRSMISRLRPALKAAQKSWGVTLGSSPFPFPRDCSSHHHTPWVPNIISCFLF